MQTKKIAKLENVLMILKSIVFIFLCTIIVQQGLLSLSSTELVTNDNQESLKTFVLFLVQELIFIAPLIYYLGQKKFKLKSLYLTSLKEINIKKASVNIISAFIIFFSFSIFLNVVSIHYGIDIPGFGQQTEHLELFGSDQYSLFISLISLVIIAPVVEELLFRGLFQSLLKRNYSSKASILFSALIFSTIHFEFEVIIPLFILGMIIGWLYENNRNLWIPITFHIINNGLAFLLEYYM